MTLAKTRITLDKRSLRELAVAGDCDPRTIERYVNGELVRLGVRDRIEAALRGVRGGRHAKLLRP